MLPIATVYLTRPVVNAVAGGKMGQAMLYGALIAGALLLTELLSGAAKWIRGVQAELLKDHISSLIHTKSVEADLAFYESAEFYDRLHRARDEASYRPLTLLESMGSAVQNGITLAAMAAVLIPFGIWLPAALFLSTLPALYVVARFTLKQHRLWEENTAGRTPLLVLRLVLTSGETAAEVRLFGLGNHFKKLYQAVRLQPPRRTPQARQKPEPRRIGRRCRRTGNYRRIAAVDGIQGDGGRAHSGRPGALLPGLQ